MSTRLTLRESLVTLRNLRRDNEVVITSMGTAREWMALAASGLHELDFVFVPSSMGQATSLGLGIALARPDLRVIVCSGDGSLLMNLGSLVTITAERPENLYVLVFENGVYEITGAQPTPGSAYAREQAGAVDYAAIARACGFQAVYRFSDQAAWEGDARSILDSAGPMLAVLDVAPVDGAAGPRSPGPTGDRAARFAAAIRAVVPRPPFRVRAATPADSLEIEALVQAYVGDGSLLPRTAAFIAENATDFVVAEENGVIVGCAHLDDYAPSRAELRSLAVQPDRKGAGIGRAVAAAIEALARKREYATLFAVSNDEPFFLRLGFEKRDVPELDKERSAVSRYKGVYAKRLR